MTNYAEDDPLARLRAQRRRVEAILAAEEAAEPKASPPAQPAPAERPPENAEGKREFWLRRFEELQPKPPRRDTDAR